MATPTDILDQLVSLSKQPGFEADERRRSQALGLSKQLTAHFQKPEDAALELSFWPSFTFAARIAVALGLFNKLVESSTPLSTSALAEATRGEALLIDRVLRPLASLGAVAELGEKLWSKTPLTTILTAPPIQAGFVHNWDQGVGSMSRMQDYFKERGYVSPSSPTDGALQYSFGTKKEAFEFWHENPQILDNFNTLMSGIRGSRPSWIKWFPVQERLLDGCHVPADAPLLVDIAGGRGHDVEAFKTAFPDQPGRLILEDLAPVIDDIKALDPGIETVKHDFFTPQPIIGARVYFFHFILHDWSDEACLKILRNTTAAMKPGHSKLLLNEFILPDRNCPLLAAGFDLNMMAMHAGKERTQHDWSQLLAEAGLQVKQFWMPPGDGEGIVEAELMH